MSSRAAPLAAVLALALCQGIALYQGVPLHQGVPLWPAPAAAAGEEGVEADCPPEVEQALADSARTGVERDVAILRHPAQGIRDPDSILDFSCLDDLFDFRRFDILFDPGRAMPDLLGLVQRRICAAAREAYRSYVGRPLDAALYTVRTPRLPGLGPIRTTARPYRAGSAEGGQGVSQHQGVPLLRDIVGGGR